MFSARARRLTRVSRLSLFVAVGLLMAAGVASAGGSHGHGDFEPGAAGAGDPYFPLDGNGGYDVKHYFLDVAYDPDTDVLDGVATITARATQNLSSFNLDLVGLTVRFDQGRRSARDLESRDGQELTIMPKDGIRKNRKFTIVVRYSGIPESSSTGRGLHRHGRRRARLGRAARGRELVPGQRPPERQGLVHLRGHGAGGPRGRRQRRARGQADEARLDDLDLGGEGADGLLPRDGCRSASSTSAPTRRTASASGTPSTPISTRRSSRARAASSRSRRRASRPTSGSSGRSPCPAAARP